MTKAVKTRINGKWDVILPEHRAIRPEWNIKNGGWEKNRLDSMFETTKPGDNVYYVGAEEGDMCALLQMWGANLLMFEPNPDVWANIKFIWEQNDLEMPAYCFDAFASRKTDMSTADMIAVRQSFPVSADGPVIGDHGFKNLTEADGSISQVKIDDVVEFTDIAPSMISIDVEGAEWEVLRGAEASLKKYHPRIYLSLHPEFLYEQYREYAGDLRQWLKNMGYAEKFLDYQHEVHLLYKWKAE